MYVQNEMFVWMFSGNRVVVGAVFVIGSQTKYLHVEIWNIFRFDMLYIIKEQLSSKSLFWYENMMNVGFLVVGFY